MVVYANTITKTEQNEATGEDEEHKIPFMKGYTVFNVEQIDELPAHYYATAQAPQLETAQRLEKVEQFFKNTGVSIGTAAIGLFTQSERIMCKYHLLSFSKTQKAITLLCRMNAPTEHATPHA